MENKKIKYVLFTDIHIKKSNIQEITTAITDVISFCKENNITECYCLGDIFESRIAQTQEVLSAFDNIIELFSSNNITLYSIAGNHDKTDYSNEYSFLEPFRHNPSFVLCNENTNIKGVNLRFQPYFKEDILVEKIKNISVDKGEDFVLLGHFAVSGSRNNDGSIVEGITSKDLKKFKKVFLGHYHNTQEPLSNVVHIPSLIQHNFGEDSNKGFTVVYEDLSYSIVKTSAKEYVKQVIDLDKFSNKDIVKLIDQHKNSDNEIRFEFLGDESKLKSIDKSIFISNGIDVKIKVKEVEDNTEFDEVEMKEYDNSSILEEFTLFCEENSFPEIDGCKYLKNHLKIE